MGWAEVVVLGILGCRKESDGEGFLDFYVIFCLVSLGVFSWDFVYKEIES